QKLVMFTGDKESAAHQIAAELGLDEIHSGLLPQQKVEMMEILQSRKSKNERLAFVGDGINDAPVLARSDLGIAMGGLGSDAAIEAADIVIMNDEPGKLPVAVRIARDTRTIVIENIVFALGVKAIVLALGAVGLATMWQAVFADVGVTIIAVINSLRLMRGNY
ncbi:MAG: HAD-IC family P-type ATPase, partial [Syntrophomonadaceae bacterium]